MAITHVKLIAWISSLRISPGAAGERPSAKSWIATATKEAVADVRDT
jgi:hypothetical protein